VVDVKTPGGQQQQQQSQPLWAHPQPRISKDGGLALLGEGLVYADNSAHNKSGTAY
jgi:hypothetical protein